MNSVWWLLAGGFVWGFFVATVITHVERLRLVAEKRALEEENAGLRILGKHLGLSVTEAEIVEVLDAHRPAGVPRAQWFAAVRRAMDASSLANGEREKSNECGS